MNSTIRFIWQITIFVLIVQGIAAYGDLPAQMSSHFDFSGQADATSSKQSFYWSWYGSVLLVNFVLMIVGPLTRRLPTSVMNVPNREYWFATPERKAEALRKLASMMAAIASGVNVMLILLFQCVVSYNLHGKSSYPFWVAFLTLPPIMIAPLVWVFRAFRLPGE